MSRDIIISGFGDEEVNGLYTRIEDRNGHHAWRKDSTHYVQYFPSYMPWCNSPAYYIVTTTYKGGYDSFYIDVPKYVLFGTSVYTGTWESLRPITALENVNASDTGEIIHYSSSSSETSSFSSESSSSGKTPIISDLYWNDRESIIDIDYRVKNDRTYTWDGGSWVVPTDGFGRITYKCDRVLIYTDVYHNGSTYILPTDPDYVLVPSKTYGSEVPNESPFVNGAWNYYDCYLARHIDSTTNVHEYSLKIGLPSDKTFDVNPDTLFEELMLAKEMPIAPGKHHSISIICAQYQLSQHAREGAKFITNADVKMKAIAWGETSPSPIYSSSSSSSLGYSSESSTSSTF